MIPTMTGIIFWIVSKQPFFPLDFRQTLKNRGDEYYCDFQFGLGVKNRAFCDLITKTSIYLIDHPYRY